MGAKALLWVIGLGLLCSGCSVVSTATHVVSSRVKESFNDCAEQHRNQQWARSAWESVQNAQPAVVFSEDYAKGFQNGFTEHLYRGTLNPPPLPPESYRHVRYQTPQGYRSIEDWFAGFRYGVSVAESGGYREYITGPSALRARAPAPAAGCSAPPGGCVVAGLAPVTAAPVTAAPLPVLAAPTKAAPVTPAQPAIGSDEEGEKKVLFQLEWKAPAWKTLFPW